MINTKALKQNNATIEAQERKYRRIFFSLKMLKVLLDMTTKTETITNNIYSSYYTNDDNSESCRLSILVHSAGTALPVWPKTRGRSEQGVQATQILSRCPLPQVTPLPSPAVSNVTVSTEQKMSRTNPEHTASQKCSTRPADLLSQKEKNKY